MNYALKLDNVCKTYETSDFLLDNVSFEVVFALTMLVNTFSDGNVSDTLYYISLLVVTAITIITFIFSCVLTKQIFQHCEY